MGLCESGKTQMFSQLCHGVDVLSVTSIKESSGKYTTGNVSYLETYFGCNSYPYDMILINLLSL